MFFPYDQRSIFVGYVLQPIEGATPAGSHLARLAFHEKHRHILTTMLAVSRSMDETPSFVVAIAVVKLRLNNAYRSCFRDSVSIFILSDSSRDCTDGDEGIY
jgi:hypothetical protein